MMKNTVIALSILPFACMAFDGSGIENDPKQMAVLKKLGLPTPETRLEVLPTDNNISDLKKRGFMLEQKEMKKNGFVNRTSDRASEIIGIKKSLQKQFANKPMITRQHDTEIRKHADEILFAYSYVGVPTSSVIEHYGFAPTGTFVENENKGWTGGGEFFKTSFATCAYTEKNMRAANGSARVFEDEATRDVNGKVTFIDVEGNESSGFLYRVHWFDDIFNRDLECATMKFSESTKNATIELAKKIDNN